MAGNKVNVYGELKESIQFLEMRPGAKIVEAELAKEFGVSRTPVREALKRLEEEQFIDIYPQRGTYVSKIDFTVVKEMAYMRHLLETSVLRELCAKKIQVRSAVEENLLMMELSLKNGDYKSYIRQDALFHRALFEIAGHVVLWDTIAGFLAHYTRVLVLDMMLPENLAASYKSHQKITECIENGDLEELERIMEVHHDHEMTEADRKLKEMHPDFFN